jgi:hypothetical protein
MDKKTTDNLKEESTWLRLVFIILYAILLNITQLVIGVVVVIQFLSKLFTGKVVEQSTIFGQNLSTYVYEIIRFLTFKSDEMPWPINPWPSGPPSDDPGKEQSAPMARNFDRQEKEQERKDAETEGSDSENSDGSDEPEEKMEKAEKAEKPKKDAAAKSKAKRRAAKITKTKSPPKSE